jgi:hypothetical protein
MKKVLIFLFVAFLCVSSFSQGPNQTFCKFKKVNDASADLCSSECARFVLIYEKGTFMNAIPAALGIDSLYVLTSEKGRYTEYQIPAGTHEVTIPQGIQQGSAYITIMDTIRKEEFPGFIILHTISSSIGDYELYLSSESRDINFNLLLQPCNTKMIPHKVYYITFTRLFESGKTYYFKTIKLPGGYSLACGPIITETTGEDFERIVAGETIKEKGDPVLYKRMEE